MRESMELNKINDKNDQRLDVIGQITKVNGI